MEDIDYKNSYYIVPGDTIGYYGMRIYLHVDGSRKMQEILTPMSKWRGPDKTDIRNKQTWRGYEFGDAFGKVAIQACEAGGLHELEWCSDSMQLVLK